MLTVSLGDSHLIIPPQAAGAVITLLFMTHAIAYIIGRARRGH